MTDRFLRKFVSISLAFLVTVTVSASAAPPRERYFSAQDVKAESYELYERMKASHFDLYARRPKPDYDAFYRTMTASFTQPMTAFEIRVAFQRFLAFGRIAHANIAFPADAYGAYRDAGGKAMPVYFRAVRGAAVVTENYSGILSIVAGDEIVALNGEPMSGWLARLAKNVSADNDYMANTLLENRFAALLWLELGAANSFTLKLHKRGGNIFDVEVPARTRDETREAARQQAPSLDLDWDKRLSRISGNGVAYLRPGPFYNNDPNAANIWDTTQFAAFIDGAFQSYLSANVRSLVIDLRDNPGGDNSFSDLMVSWFANKPFRFASDFRIKVSEAAIDSNQKRVILAPNDKESMSHKLAAAYAQRRVGEVFSFEIPMAQPRTGARFQGKVFILINRGSYSNTVQVAALSQDYKFATILGEETSDLATTYGAMEQFALSRTGIDVNFPKALIIRANGDRAARGVIPDVVIETPIVQSKDDRVLMRALDVARAR